MASTKPAGPKPEMSKRAPATPKTAGAQEAKDLKTLIGTLSDQNSPASSKEITAYAKQTLKLVGQSQKAESAAFKREATKTLIEFRNFVEKSQKVTDIRRAKLLKDIDSVSLDTKNASLMMISVAKEQAKNIKAQASREAATEKMRIKQIEKSVLEEASLKSKEMVSEAKLKSKALSEEQNAKFKAIKDEREARFKMLMDTSKASIQKQKDSLKERRESHKAKVSEDAEELKSKKQLRKESYDNLQAQLKQTYDDRKAKLEANKAQLKQTYDDRKAKLDTTKAEQIQKNEEAKANVKQLRDDASLKIKQLKNDLRDDYKQKMIKGKESIAEAKSNNAMRNKTRIQKIRDMQDEHKIKLQKIREDAKGESLIAKAAIKSKLSAAQEKKATRLGKASSAADGLMDKGKNAIAEEAPLLYAAGEIGKGLHGMFVKHKDKREKKALNKLAHADSKNPTSNSKPNPTPNPVPDPKGAPSGGGDSDGGMFGGILTMIPAIVSSVESMMGFFKMIGKGASKLGPLLKMGKTIPIVGEVIAVVMGIFDFIEGFNDASSLFGEKVEDGDYTKRIFSGFVSVVGSILGIFDTVAGWLGFDTNIEGNFKKGAVMLFNMILDSFKSIVGGLGDLLSYIPGMGDVAKKMQDYGKTKSAVPVDSPPNSAAANIAAKQDDVDNLKDDVAGGRAKAAVNVVTDNSVQSSNTTINQSKMDTRNDDRTLKPYGYGANTSFA
jgi:hypothetical protein